MKTRLMIVDDHEVVRMGLRAALEVEPDFNVVAEAGGGKEAIEKARAHQPDIILMDVRMDGMDGIEACREIRDERPETRVLMLTSFAEEETVVAALLAEPRATSSRTSHAPACSKPCAPSHAASRCSTRR